jgi:septum formation protein
MRRRLILASASPARRALLESAGLAPEVIVSNVDESGVADRRADEAVLILAERKARAVAGQPAVTASGALIVACDSLLSFEGETWGKASTPQEVSRRWRRFRGRQGTLHTGHFLVDTSSGRYCGAVDGAVIYFGRPSDAEIEAYAQTEEALAVAGPFTLEGRSAPWIDSIQGNYGTVTGISLPVLRRLLASLGLEVVDLWS